MPKGKEKSCKPLSFPSCSNLLNLLRMLITFCINNTSYSHSHSNSNKQNLRTRQQKRTARQFPLTSSSLLQPAHVTPTRHAPFLERQPELRLETLLLGVHVSFGALAVVFVGAYFYYLTLSFAALQLIFACSLWTCVRVGRDGKRGVARVT